MSDSDIVRRIAVLHAEAAERTAEAMVDLWSADRPSVTKEGYLAEVASARVVWSALKKLGSELRVSGDAIKVGPSLPMVVCFCGLKDIPRGIDRVKWYWQLHGREVCTLELPNERCWCGLLRSEHVTGHMEKAVETLTDEPLAPEPDIFVPHPTREALAAAGIQVTAALVDDDNSTGIATAEAAGALHQGELKLKVSVGSRTGDHYLSREMWEAFGEHAGWRTERVVSGSPASADGTVERCRYCGCEWLCPECDGRGVEASATPHRNHGRARAPIRGQCATCGAFGGEAHMEPCTLAIKRSSPDVDAGRAAPREFLDVSAQEWSELERLAENPPRVPKWLRDAVVNKGLASLEWLDSTKSVARIGLRSTVATSVREWQQDSSNKYHTSTLMLDDLEHAEVFDVDDMCPLLEDARLAGDDVWGLVPKQWQKLVRP